MLTANLPVAINDSYQMDANTALNGASVLINDFDADGDEITQATLNSTTSNGSLSLAIDGTFTYTPTNGFVGVDQFTYVARDALNGENSANIATVTIHVGIINDLPVADDVEFDTAVNTTLNGTVTASDANGDPLTFTGGSITTENGFVTLFQNGDFTYDPDPGFEGTDSFTFKANDGFGDGPEATVTINVGSSQTNTPPVGDDKSVTISVDEVLNDTLTATDDDGDDLTYSLGNTSPANGTVTVNSDGTFTYTPNGGFNGNDSFTFIVNDGTDDSEEATVSIVVGNSNENQAPTVDSASGTTGVDTALEGTLTGSDPEDDPLTFALGGTSPANGTVVVNTDGTFTYTPNAGFVGNDSFTFIANDGDLDSDEGTFSITVTDNGDNTAPVADDVTFDTPLDTDLSGTLTATDEDGDDLVFSAVTDPTNGTLVLNADGTFTYTPDTGFTGSDSFTFKVNDGTVDSQTATVTINVDSDDNSAPIAEDASFSTDVGLAVDGTLTATDADDDDLSFVLVTDVENGVLVLNQDGTFTYTPDAGFNGSDSFTYQVNDGTVDSEIATVTFTVGSDVNTPPVATPASINTSMNTPVDGTLAGTDADDDPLTFAVATEPQNGTLVLNEDGTYTYTPDTDYNGSDSFTFTVNDGTVDSQAATVTVLVGSVGNTTPVANPASISTSADTPFSGTLTGTDADSDPLTFTVVSDPANGTVALDSNGDFIYTPDSGFTGSDSFTFKVNDGTEDSAVATVNVTVGSTSNSPPVVIDSSINVLSGTIYTGSLTAFDADGDELTFATVSSTVNGTLVLNTDGSFTYTPNVGFSGTDQFSYNVNDGTETSGTATVSITVGSDVNTPPVANSQAITVTQNVVFTGMLTATDADGDTLTYSAGTMLAEHGTVTINQDGSFTYTPDADFIGIDQFSFVANDGTTLSSEAIVQVNVQVGNSIPTADAVTFNIDTDEVLSGTLTATDPDDDPLTFEAGLIGAEFGTVTLNDDGTFTYTPDAGFTGTDYFSFRVNDGTYTSADALVEINVGVDVNLPPVAGDQTVDVALDTQFTGTLQGTDADGDTLTFAAGTVVTTNGTVVINSDGTFTYTPNSGFIGQDFFSFKVNDGTADSTVDGLVTLNVGLDTGNVAPVVINGSGTVMAGDSLTGSLSTLGSDADGDTLSYSLIAQPQNGVITLSADGNFQYTPTAGFTGTDTFTFQASDGTLLSNVGVFTITISEDNPGSSFDLELSDVPGTIATRRRDVVPLDSTAMLTNIDPETNFANTALTATIISGAHRRDKIVVTDGAGGEGAIDVRGRKIRFNGVEVARIEGGRRGRALHVNFNGSASEDAVNAVLQRIGLRTGRRATVETRVIEISVNADGHISTGTIEANVGGSIV